MRISLIISAAVAFVAACATVSPRLRLQNQLMELGFNEARAECLANDLDDRLDRGELRELGEILEDLNESDSAGRSLDVFLSIDNPGLAPQLLASTFACALNR